MPNRVGSNMNNFSNFVNELISSTNYRENYAFKLLILRLNIFDRFM
jgi:hypothetical protein